jgi:hypothetical protein
MRKLYQMEYITDDGKFERKKTLRTVSIGSSNSVTPYQSPGRDAIVSGDGGLPFTFKGLGASVKSRVKDVSDHIKNQLNNSNGVVNESIL